MCFIQASGLGVFLSHSSKNGSIVVVRGFTPNTVCIHRSKSPIRICKLPLWTHSWSQSHLHKDWPILKHRPFYWGLPPPENFSCLFIHPSTPQDVLRKYFFNKQNTKLPTRVQTMMSVQLHLDYDSVECICLNVTAHSFSSDREVPDW